MATPNWDILHYRLAAGVRDAISAPGSGDWTAGIAPDGKDLTRADRENYLNYAWQKFIGLFYRSIEEIWNRGAINKLDLFRSGFPALVKSTTVAVTSGTADLSSTPTDFGIALDLQIASASIKPARPDEWPALAAAVNPEVAPSATMIYWMITGTTLQILPASGTNGTYNLSYAVKPHSVVQFSGTDIPLGSHFFNTILLFAYYAYYRDKQEFNVAQEHLAEAYRSSPIVLAPMAESK